MGYGMKIDGTVINCDFEAAGESSDAMFRYVSDWAAAQTPPATVAQLRAAILGIRNGGGISGTAAHNTGIDSLRRYIFARKIIDAVKES